MMTLNGSMDGKAFSVFVKHFLVPNLWEGAVVVMDNFPAHSSGGDWAINSIGWRQNPQFITLFSGL